MFLGNGNQTLVYGNKLFVPTSLAVSMYLGRFARPSFYEHRVSYVQYLPQTFENFKHLLKVLLLAIDKRNVMFSLLCDHLFICLFIFATTGKSWNQILGVNRLWVHLKTI